MAGTIQDDIRKFTLEINESKNNGETLASINKLQKSTSKLRQENEDLQKVMGYLASQGKKNSDEYRRMDEQLKSNRKTIAQNNNEMKGLTKTLDLNYMSMGQLKKRALELRSSLNATVKAADPDEYNRLETELRQVGTQMDKLSGKSAQTKSAMGKLGEFLPVIGFAALVSGAKNLITNVINVRKEFEKYEAVLKNSLGSQSEARKEMRMLAEFAAETPFQLSELTGAFVKLTNYGLKPSREEMRAYGDIAASVGKTFDQWAEAVADSITGENERLKEFGIRASKHGETISYTFRGVTTDVQNNAEAIKNYLVSLGDVEGVAGSMAAISEKLGGRISNLGDAWDTLMNTMGSQSSGIMITVINWLIDLSNAATDAAKSIGMILQEVADDEQASATKNALDEINNLTSAYVKNGMTRIEAEKKARQTYISSLEQQMNTARAMLPTLIGIDKKAMNNRLTMLSLEYIGVVDHYKKLDELAKKNAETNNALQSAKAEKKAISRLEEDFKQKKQVLSQQLTEETITRGQYNNQIYALEADQIAKMSALRLKDADEMEKLASKILDKKMELQKQQQAMLDVASGVDADLGVDQKKEELDVQKMMQSDFTKFLADESAKQIKVIQNQIEFEKRVQDEREALTQAQINAATSVAGSLTGLVDESSAAYLAFFALEKAAAIADVWVNYAKELSLIAVTAAAMNAVSFGIAGTAYAAIAKKKAFINAITNTTIIGAQAIGQVAQHEDGKYPVVGAGDGKTYNTSFAGSPDTGLYNGPQLGIFNEDPNNPELVVDGKTTRKLMINYPQVYKGITNLAQGEAPQFAAGKYPQTSSAASSSTIYQSDPELKNLLAKLSAQLGKPIRATVNKYGVGSLDEANNDIDRFNSKVYRNK